MGQDKKILLICVVIDLIHVYKCMILTTVIIHPTHPVVKLIVQLLNK